MNLPVHGVVGTGPGHDTDRMALLRSQSDADGDARHAVTAT